MFPIVQQCPLSGVFSKLLDVFMLELNNVSNTIYRANVHDVLVLKQLWKKLTIKGTRSARRNTIEGQRDLLSCQNLCVSQKTFFCYVKRLV